MATQLLWLACVEEEEAASAISVFGFLRFAALAKQSGMLVSQTACYRHSCSYCLVNKSFRHTTSLQFRAEPQYTIMYLPGALQESIPSRSIYEMTLVAGQHIMQVGNVLHCHAYPLVINDRKQTSYSQVKKLSHRCSSVQNTVVATASMC